MLNKRLCSLGIIASLLVGIISFGYEEEAYAYDDYFTYIDEYYHTTGDYGYEKHEWEDEDISIIKQSTLTSKGKAEYKCWLCGGKKTKTYSWKLDDPLSEYHKSYNVVDHTLVFPKSKSITVWLDAAKKGSIVKVKIGKKSYSKRVGRKKKIKIKIKNPKYGSRIRIKVYYKGRLIGRSYWWDNEEDDYFLDNEEIVYYARNIKEGMTKKQVKCLYYWGDSSDKSSASGGWSYWNYSDGSYIGFKNGRVQYWYDAAR